MVSMPFSITVDYPFWPEDGCVHVVAMPHVIIYRIPRNHTTDLAGYEDMKKAGIYLLVNTEKQTLYVGQADSRDNGNGILARMLEQHKQKKEIDEWDIGYALICAVPNLFGATELNYLERYFYDEAKTIGRYRMLNGSRPHASGVNNYTMNNLNSFIPPALFLLERHMGFDAYVPQKKQIAEKKQTEKELSVDKTAPAVIHETAKKPQKIEKIPSGIKIILDSKKSDVYAIGYLQEDNTIIVEQKSRISPENKLAGQKGKIGQYQLREELCQNGTIKKHVFVKRYTFSSPSNAATVILGCSTSGSSAWKTESGLSLGDYQKTKNEQAKDPREYHMTARNSDAYGYKGTEGGFIVLKGSRIANETTNTFKKRKMDKQREFLINTGVIANEVFTCDWLFSSISMAATIVSGQICNGYEVWKEV